MELKVKLPKATTSAPALAPEKVSVFPVMMMGVTVVVFRFTVTPLVSGGADAELKVILSMFALFHVVNPTSHAVPKKFPWIDPLPQLAVPPQPTIPLASQNNVAPSTEALHSRIAIRVLKVSLVFMVVGS